MEEGIDANIIKATQLSLGKYVKRPPLTEKLLKKPPFRFLHDIITTVLKNTGFFEGLFSEEELISENVKDRERKIIFLNKVITVLGLATGQTLTVKPSKIVAGQEPAKTNELLQCLGQALEKKLSSDEAVKKYKENIKSSSLQDKKNKDTTKGQDVKKGSEKLKEVNKIPTKNHEKRNSKLEPKENMKIKSESPPKKVRSITNLKKNLNKNSQNQNKPSLNEKSSQENLSNLNQSTELKEKSENSRNGVDCNENNEKDNAPKPIDNIDTAQVQKNEDEKESNCVDHTDLESKSSNNHIINNIDQEKSNEQQEIIDIETSENIKFEPDKEITIEEQQQKPINVDVRKEKTNESFNSTTSYGLESNSTKSIEKRPQSVRPSSSRPGAPRVKNKHDTVLSHETHVVHKVNIIAENTVTEEEEDSSIIIIDNQTDTIAQNEGTMQLSSDQHGHLVQQILDSQKEFSQVSGKTEIEWQFGAQKARDVVNQEIEQVKFNVQALSRISNPLGKLIDHIQEDVEVMRQELQEWIRKYEETSEELSKQRIGNVEFLQPLQAKLKQLDAEIEDKRDKINDLSIVVFKNYYRIEKLLSSGNVQ